MKSATPAQLWDALVHTECCLLLRETELGIRRFKKKAGAMAEAKEIITEHYGKRPPESTPSPGAST